MFILGSPWESDVIQVNKSLTYYEYELKVSRQDFFADLKKRVSKWGKNAEKLKCDYYAGRETWKKYDRKIPKPSKFFYVIPENLLDINEVPDYTGLIEVGSYTKITKPAKKLKGTKLSEEQLWNLSMKLSNK